MPVDIAVDVANREHHAVIQQMTQARPSQDRKMVDIETDVFSARNKVTGARIDADPRRPNGRDVDVWYENPNFELKIGIRKKPIVEKRDVQIKGRTLPWEVVLGVLLEKDELRNKLKRIKNRPSDQVDYVINDFYSLMAAQCKSYHELYYGNNPDATFDIYESARDEFNPFLYHPLSPGDVAASNATLIARF